MCNIRPLKSESNTCILDEYGHAMINAVKQVGKGGMYFWDILYEGVGKTPISA